MKRLNLSSPLARAGSILSLMVALVCGITFAALQSQNATVTGNTITSATANLQVGAGRAGSFGSSTPGFNFTNVVPGGGAAPAGGYDVYFKNAGSTMLDVRLALNKTTILNPGNIDLAKVHLVLTPLDRGTPLNLTLASLYDAYDSGGTSLDLTMPVGETDGYELQVALDSNVSPAAASISLTNIDLIFSASSITS